MKHTLRFLSAALFFCTTLVQANPGDVDRKEAIYVSDQYQLVSRAQHEDNKNAYYTIDINYPQIQGKNLSPAAQQYNVLVADTVNQEIDRFKKYVAADMPHMKNLPDEVMHNSLNIDYDVDVLKPGNSALISTRISIEGMQAGRAHPYHSNRVINFDLASGKLLALKDLFKPKSPYLKAISDYSKMKLGEKLTDKWMIAEGTKPVEKNFKNWNLESDGLVITFDEYQVGPYSDGVQEVHVPFTALKDLIPPASPIALCLTDPKSCSAEVILPDQGQELAQAAN